MIFSFSFVFFFFFYILINKKKQILIFYLRTPGSKSSRETCESFLRTDPSCSGKEWSRYRWTTCCCKLNRITSSFLAFGSGKINSYEVTLSSFVLLSFVFVRFRSFSFVRSFAYLFSKRSNNDTTRDCTYYTSSKYICIHAHKYKLGIIYLCM